MASSDDFFIRYLFLIYINIYLKKIKINNNLVKNKFPITIIITSKKTEQDSTINDTIIYFFIVQCFFMRTQHTLLMLFYPLVSFSKNISNNLYFLAKYEPLLEFEE